MSEPICSGIVVVEAGGGSIAGSLAGMVLADNGARVIKLEPPEGDPMRRWSPSGFLVWNRGKESLVADLRTPAGRERARSLLLAADVFIEAFGTGRADSWDLGYVALAAENPGLVYCSVKGFGSMGPYAGLKAYEGVVAAKAGLYSWAISDSGRARSSQVRHTPASARRILPRRRSLRHCMSASARAGASGWRPRWFRV
jgi:crotonobetainyl-CoA:carnitine CoA-transferase CaiB-like acyl-CoA transferase